MTGAETTPPLEQGAYQDAASLLAAASAAGKEQAAQLPPPSNHPSFYVGSIGELMRDEAADRHTGLLLARYAENALDPQQFMTTMRALSDWLPGCNLPDVRPVGSGFALPAIEIRRALFGKIVSAGERGTITRSALLWIACSPYSSHKDLLMEQAFLREAAGRA